MPHLSYGLSCCYVCLYQEQIWQLTNYPKDGRHFIKNITKSQNIASRKIDRIEVTSDTLTSRAGLTPFVRYLDSINIYPKLEDLFKSIRKNSKSNMITDIFKQLFCFLADGTSRHISRFDELKKDDGYAAGIECSLKDMLSSHSVKRFYRKFYYFHYFKFRELSSEDLALAYKQLMRVEEAWKTMKSGLDLRPVYHRTPERIRVHVYLCVLGLLIERVAEKATGETWRNIRNTLRTQKIGQLFTPNGCIYQAANPRPEACKLYKQLKIDPPRQILAVE